jgi:hypothetical protein
MGRPTITLLMVGLLCLVPASSTTAQSPAPPATPSVLGAGTDALDWLTSLGIADPTATPTADGQMRWEATLPFADIRVEFVGTDQARTSTSLSTRTSTDYYAGSIIVRWAQQFDPDSLGFIVDALLRGAFVDELEAEAESPGGTVLVSTVKDDDAPSGEESMSITITING